MAGRFTTSTLEQVRAASDIVDVIGAVIPLKRAGANFVALCPFHREKTPSFNVNPQRQIFHCFGCHKGGDVFKFIQEYENVDFAGAVRRLAERAHIPLETESTSASGPERHIKERLWDVHERITQYWQKLLNSHPAARMARDYLNRRGVTSEAIQLFRLGYAPDSWEDTVAWVRAQGIPPELAEQAGLIVRRDNGQGHYDRFRGRLIFPICDEQGRVIAFSGRILQEDVKTAKYLNSPESPVFAKRKVFFGLDKSKRHILEAQSAILCEGQLDLISCFMAGIKNVVAPQGTALTADHTRLLKRFASEVVLCFDADRAGQAAAIRALDELLASNLAIRVATMPAPHDPDSFIREFGGARFQERIAKAEGFFDFYLGHLCAVHSPGTDRGRVNILQAFGQAVRKTGNSVLIDTYAQKAAMRLKVLPDAVRSEFAKTSPGPLPVPEEAPVPSADPPAVPPPPQEYWLLKLLFQDEINLPWAARHIAPESIQHAGVRQIVVRRFESLHRDAPEEITEFLNRLDNPNLQSLLTAALAESRSIPEPARQLRDLALRFRNEQIDRELALLCQQADQPGLEDTKLVQILERQQDLRRLKKQPLPPVEQSA